MKHSREFNHILLMVLSCLLPLFLIFILVANGVAVNPILFGLTLLLGCLVMFYLMGQAPLADQTEAPVEEMVKPDREIDSSIVQGITDIFQPLTHYQVHGQWVIEGRLLEAPENAYQKLKDRFAPHNLMPVLQEDDAGRVLLMFTNQETLAGDGSTRFPWLNLGLFIATLITTTWAGAAHQGVDLLQEPQNFAVGLPYALALMFILGAHELGHYFTARAHGMKVTLPYFIPIPFALGTFGAFIQMKSATENRRVLFDVGVSGPLAGLVFAIPALLIGLKYSTVVSGSTVTDILHGGADIGSSMLLAFVAKLALGEAVTEGHRLILHPLAFAGWLGLLVTALNLLPIGQLDGGHIAHALFGRKKGDAIGQMALFSLFLLGLFVWSGFLVWAIIVFFIAGAKSAPPLDDVSRVDKRRLVLGVIAFTLLFLILIPVPHAFYQSMGIHCPYV